MARKEGIMLTQNMLLFVTPVFRLHSWWALKGMSCHNTNSILDSHWVVFSTSKGVYFLNRSTIFPVSILLTNSLLASHSFIHNQNALLNFNGGLCIMLFISTQAKLNYHGLFATFSADIDAKSLTVVLLYRNPKFTNWWTDQDVFKRTLNANLWMTEMFMGI